MSDSASLEILIREARRDDAAAIAGLSTQLGYPTTPEQSAERLRRVESDPDHLALVAQRGGQVVGWIHLAATHSLDSEPCGEILGLVIDQHERGQGIGQRLAAAAVEWARGRGLEQLKVRSNVVRERAHGFYERQGFATVKSQKVFVKRLD